MSPIPPQLKSRHPFSLPVSTIHSDSDGSLFPFPPQFWSTTFLAPFIDRHTLVFLVSMNSVQTRSPLDPHSRPPT